MSKKINRTYSFTKETIEKLELLMAKAEYESTSEYIRELINAEADKQGIILEKEEFHNSVSNKLSRSEVVRRLTHVEQLLLQINYKLKDNNAMTYQIRDGINSYLNFAAIEPSYYESETEKAEPHKCLTQSELNYENKMRRLAVEKANAGK